MIFRQFCSQRGRYSYLFADSVTREAALIDATAELIDDYRGMLEEYDLQLRLLLATGDDSQPAPELEQLCTHSGANDPAAASSDGLLFLGEDSVRLISLPQGKRCYAWREAVFSGKAMASNDPAANTAVADRLLQILPGDTCVYAANAVGAMQLSACGTCHTGQAPIADSGSASSTNTATGQHNINN